MKIFGIGLNKTGTKTLGFCFKFFGYKNTSFNFDDLVHFHNGHIDFLLNKIKGYDSCEDWPWPLLFKNLDKNFPEAKFILTKRKTPDIWFKSLCKHAERTGPTQARKLVYGYEMPHLHPRSHIKFYNRHNQNITKYFKNRPEKLLELCWEDGDGWPEFCHFIKKPCPDSPFPHLNKSPF